MTVQVLRPFGLFIQWQIIDTVLYNIPDASVTQLIADNVVQKYYGGGGSLCVNELPELTTVSPDDYLIVYHSGVLYKTLVSNISGTAPSNTVTYNGDTITYNGDMVIYS